MGMFVLIIAFIAEFTFAGYCLVTRSWQTRFKSYLALGAFATFVLLALVAVIQWSFRWYLLGGLLFIWAALGAIRLVGKQTNPKPFSSLRSVFSAIGVLLLVFLTVIPALIFPQLSLPKPTGGFGVATTTFTYTDESRVETFTNTGELRKVNVQFWYPQGADSTYPLVVFSHGTGGIKISNTSTFMDLASNGYIVCSIDHPYHSQFTLGEGGTFVRMDQAYWQEYLSVVNDTVDDATKFALTQKWLNLRVTDMDFVLDTILAQVNDASSAEVYRLIDPTRIGLIGHSIGGAASGQLARERSDISAVINLDGDLNGEYVDFVDGKKVLNDQPYPVSILNIFSDDMAHGLDAIPNVSDVVAAEHILLSAPHGHDVRLKGTNHFSVTDLPLVSPFFVSLLRGSVPAVGGATADPYATIEQMNGIILQFFNAYLKGK